MLGIFSDISKSFGNSSSTDSGMDVDAFMSAAESKQVVDQVQQNADAYVKPVSLQTESDIKIVEQELMKKNIVLLNITPYARNPTRLKDAIAQLKTVIVNLNGDIARIDDDKILITPTNVKIVKKIK